MRKGEAGRAMLKLVRDAVKIKSHSMDPWGLLLKSHQTAQSLPCVEAFLTAPARKLSSLDTCWS